MGLTVIIPIELRELGNRVAAVVAIGPEGNRTFSEGCAVLASAGVPSHLAAHIQSPSAHLRDLFGAVANDPQALHAYVSLAYRQREMGDDIPSLPECQQFLDESIIDLDTPWLDLIGQLGLTRIIPEE